MKYPGGVSSPGTAAHSTRNHVADRPRSMPRRFPSANSGGWPGAQEFCSNTPANDTETPDRVTEFEENGFGNL